MDNSKNENEKVRLDENGNPLTKKDADTEQKGPQHKGDQPVGNGGTGKPAAFPPHN